MISKTLILMALLSHCVFLSPHEKSSEPFTNEGFIDDLPLEEESLQPPKETYQEPLKISPHKQRLLWPLPKGVVTSHFGVRGPRIHGGTDISAPKGTPVFASWDGEVIFSGRKGSYGKAMVIKHRFGYTLYGHLHRTLKRKGTKVKVGDLIAEVGATGRATGPHLHFEVRSLTGKPYNPLALLPQGDGLDIGDKIPGR